MSDNIKIVGRMLNFSNVVLKDADLGKLEEVLKKRTENMNVEGMPVVLDTEVVVDVDSVFKIFRKFGLQPIGVVDGLLNEEAQQKNIAIFPRGKAFANINACKKKQEEKKQEQNTASENNTVVYEEVIRSGQSINNAEGDLVLMTDVHSGSEAITVGSLHIYGKAHGRVVAGATGDTSAAIFCQSLNADLISVAGVYCTKEDIPEVVRNQAAHIKYVEGEGLVFTPIK